MIGDMAASSDFFRSTCTNIFERMINTVPSNVVLTDVIEPVSVKPRSLDISVNANGTITVSGIVRVSGLPCSLANANVTSRPERTKLHLDRRCSPPWASESGAPALQPTLRFALLASRTLLHRYRYHGNSFHDSWLRLSQLWPKLHVL